MSHICLRRRDTSSKYLLTDPQLHRIFYLWFESFPLVFRDIYHFNLGVSGLPYLSFVVVACITVSNSAACLSQGWQLMLSHRLVSFVLSLPTLPHPTSNGDGSQLPARSSSRARSRGRVVCPALALHVWMVCSSFSSLVRFTSLHCIVSS